MLCPSCKHENRAGRKFCVHCGAGLGLVCPSCGARTDAGERFCGECGKPLTEAAKPAPLPDPRSYTPKHLADKILQSKSALEGERKQVTVLFCDLVGSTPLSQQLDAEKWRDLIAQYQQAAAGAVGRFGGHRDTAKFCGGRETCAQFVRHADL